jgi:ubiquinone/menaquinone biosynthesis C-methylase UbiE
VANEQRRLAFGRVAERYDRARPGYPSALVDDVVALAPGPRALEVGAGTGIATALFARAGMRITAVEPSRAMAGHARMRCAEWDTVTIEESEFEHWDRAGRTFEVLLCAQAWHWIDPDRRLALAATRSNRAVCWRRSGTAPCGWSVRCATRWRTRTPPTPRS